MLRCSYLHYSRHTHSFSFLSILLFYSWISESFVSFSCDVEKNVEKRKNDTKKMVYAALCLDAQSCEDFCFPICLEKEL